MKECKHTGPKQAIIRKLPGSVEADVSGYLCVKCGAELPKRNQPNETN